jgi:hypothetical protein
MNTERSGLSCPKKRGTPIGAREVDALRTAGGERFAVDNLVLNNCKSRGGLRL